MGVGPKTVIGLFCFFLATMGCVFRVSGAEVWHVENGFRSHALAVAARKQTGFSLLLPDQTGIAFTNVLTNAKASENQIRMNGSGVALGDVDGDGWCDVYFCGLEGGNALYRNLGDWKFTNVTEHAGVVCVGQYSEWCDLSADVDGDGDLDLLVSGRWSRHSALSPTNDGHGVLPNWSIADSITDTVLPAVLLLI